MRKKIKKTSLKVLGEKMVRMLKKDLPIGHSKTKRDTTIAPEAKKIFLILNNVTMMNNGIKVLNMMIEIKDNLKETETSSNN